MLLLVLGKNMLVTFIGWEGVGACSYLLIGFWYTDMEKAQAGQKAFIVNRIGDFAFLLGMFLLYWETNTVDYLELAQLSTTASSAVSIFGVATPAVILIFIGCTGKSAQIPLYTWLPDAMAGPTPVSALIHAATMVTSGVYLLARLNHIVTLAPVAMLIISIVGALTAFFAATIALVQTDIKKVLAYSTVSQLGYMFIGIGVGSFVGAIFHLMTHAFFKALLFLGSGSVIHANSDEQDIRKMGGLKKYMPVTHLTFLIGCIAISGFPLLSGFFSKDLILWGAFSNMHTFFLEGVDTSSIQYLTDVVAAPLASDTARVALFWPKVIHIAVFVLGLATAGLTAFYMFRLYILTFLGEFRGTAETKAHLHESPMTMTIPLAVLAVLALIGGYTGWPHFIAHATHWEWMLFFEHWFDPVFAASNEYRLTNRLGDHAVLWEVFATGISSIVAISGIALAFAFYRWYPGVPKWVVDRARALHRILDSKYKIDELYDATFVNGTILFGKAQYLFDQYVVDALVNAFGFFGEAAGRILRNLQSGDVQRYATYIVFAVVLAMLWLWRAA